MQKKMTPKQLAKWLQSLPATTNVVALEYDTTLTVQQIDAVLERYCADRRAAGALHDDLRALDRFLTAGAESDAAENMPSELNDARMLGYYRSFYNHLANAAQVHWETSNRDVNAELGRIII